MNKYLLMSAAAVLAATASGGVARASTTLHLGIPSWSGDYCDYFIVTKDAGGLYAAKHVGALNCGSSVYNDPGYKAGKTTAPFGTRTKSVGFADTVLAGKGMPYNALEFVFSYPFNPDSGGQWLILANTTGNTTIVVNHGVTSNKVRPGRHESSVAHAVQVLKGTK